MNKKSLIYFKQQLYHHKSYDGLNLLVIFDYPLKISPSVDKQTSKLRFCIINFAFAGQELMPRYADLLLKCGISATNAWNYLLQLIRWKDTRELFWMESNLSLISAGTFVGALSMNQESVSVSTAVTTVSHISSEKSLIEEESLES